MLSRCFLALLLLVLNANADIAFWVWQRPDPLSAAEIGTLRAGGIHLLYWQAGEVRQTRGIWQMQVRYPVPATTRDLRIIPTLRLVSADRSPFAPEARASLSAQINAMAAGKDLVQLDYDCPDRLLADYAAFLHDLRNAGKAISITALAGWCHRPEWPALQENVEEMVPMFYNLQADPQLDSTGPPMLLNADSVTRGLRAWDACTVPWRAGLPSFARVTIYNKGKPSGHLRAWGWDDLCFSKLLSSGGGTKDGVTTLEISATGDLAGIALTAGNRVAVRWPDRAALQSALEFVGNTRAKGAVFFRLPDGTAAGGWSVPQLVHLNVDPQPTLARADAAHLELRNESDADLPPRLAGRDPQDRGYALELDAGAPIFRDAEEGDFWRVMSHVVAKGKATRAALPLATRVTFWFSHLRAGEIRRTGLIRLAPGVDFDQLRYRILGDQPDPPWQMLR